MSPVQAVHRSEAATSLALACDGSELSIWDLECRQKQYQAKGNKPNRIGLVDKPCNTAVAFLPGSDGQKVVVGTAYHKLRVYDVKSKRPALDMQFGEAKVTALAPQSNGQQLLLCCAAVAACVLQLMWALAKNHCGVRHSMCIVHALSTLLTCPLLPLPASNRLLDVVLEMALYSCVPSLHFGVHQIH